MAWIRAGRGGRYRVAWREGDRAVRTRTLPSLAEAEALRDEMDRAWPSRPAGPRPGGPRSGGGRHKRSIQRRIADRVTIDERGCWRWQGQKNRFGYGQLNVEVGGKRMCLRTHRVSYEAYVGPIPDGLEIDHLCRVRDCANPEHLEPVTRSENVRRSYAARRAAAA